MGAGLGLPPEDSGQNASACEVIGVQCGQGATPASCTPVSGPGLMFSDGAHGQERLVNHTVAATATPGAVPEPILTPTAGEGGRRYSGGGS